jgi:hypothetical protein
MNRALAAAAIVVLGPALPGCACALRRADTAQSVEHLEDVVVGRFESDAAATRRTFLGIPDWIDREFAQSGRSLRATGELYTSCRR